MNLSDMQRKVLARIKKAPSPEMALEWTKDPNLTKARSILRDLGMVDISRSGGITLTDEGERIGIEQNIIDANTGELTEFGEEYAAIDPEEATTNSPTAVVEGNKSLSDLLSLLH